MLWTSVWVPSDSKIRLHKVGVFHSASCRCAKITNNSCCFCLNGDSPEAVGAGSELRLIVFSRKSWIYPPPSRIPVAKLPKKTWISTPDPGLPGRAIVLSVQTVEAARTIPTTKTKGPSAVTIVGEMGLYHGPYRNGRKKNNEFPWCVLWISLAWKKTRTCRGDFTPIVTGRSPSCGDKKIFVLFFLGSLKFGFLA